MARKILVLGLLLWMVAAGGAWAQKGGAKSKVDAEKLLSQFSNAKDEGAASAPSKERFEAFVRQLAASKIAWNDAWAYMDQMDDGTAMQVVCFALRLKKSKNAVLDLLDPGVDGWMWQSENMLRDKEPGAVNVLVRRVLVKKGVPAVELVLAARDRNKKVTCRGITPSYQGWPGLFPNTVSVNEAVTFIEELLK